MMRNLLSEFNLRKALVMLAVASVFIWVKADNLAAYPRNTRELQLVEFNDVSNDTIREKFVQTSNDVDCSFGIDTRWRISPEMTIGKEKYYILYRDCYRERYYYLCRAPQMDGYPQMIMLCQSNMAEETFQNFEIDEENDRIIIIDHEFITDVEYPVQGNENMQYGNYCVTTSIYKLSDNFKLIDISHINKDMDILEALIEIYP